MRPTFLLTFLAACSEYGFDGDPSAALDGFGDTGAAGAGDATSADGDETPDDPNPDDAVGNDEGDGDDPCFQSDHGYEVNPAARLFVADGSVPIVVTFTGSDSAYNDELWLESPWAQALGVGGETALGTVFPVGNVPTDTELVFGIQVRNTGDHFQSGPSSRNPDGVTHVALTYNGDCTFTVGFEDLWGGGDQDYNDVILTIEGVLRQEL